MSDDLAAAARELTQFLTRRDNYQRTSQIESMVQTEISAMARKIAALVVAENPGLSAAITDLTNQVIREALRSDTYLQTTVVKAVSEGLGQLIRERKEDE